MYYEQRKCGETLTILLELTHSLGWFCPLRTKVFISKELVFGVASEILQWLMFTVLIKLILY